MIRAQYRVMIAFFQLRIRCLHEGLEDNPHGILSVGHVLRDFFAGDSV